MKKFERPNASLPIDQDQKRLEELEREKQARRENRLKKIIENNYQLLKSLFPDEADNFEIVSEEIQERYDSTFEESVKISSSQLPAYGIFLRSKKEPEKKHQIMHWLRPDLDAKKAEFEILLNQSFAEEIKKGVEKLRGDRQV